nr:ATP-dependent DNA ligase [Lentzea xinjiangensis]
MWIGTLEGNTITGITNPHVVGCAASRNDNPLLAQFPELEALSRVCGSHSVVLDGEIVAVGRDGRPHFELRRHRRGPATQWARSKAPVQYYVFDLLHLDGQSLLDVPYLVRRQMLVDLHLPGIDPAVQVPPAFPDTDPTVPLEVARQYGLEGAMYKRADSTYMPGVRSRSWIKCPLWNSQEVVIGGWTPGSGGRASTLGSLLLGAHDEQGRLLYVGRVGTGMSGQVLRDLRLRLRLRSPPRSTPSTAQCRVSTLAPRTGCDLNWSAK